MTRDATPTPAERARPTGSRPGILTRMTGMDSQTVVSVSRRSANASRLLNWVFHLLCLVLAIGLLWESSSPGTTASVLLLFVLLASLAVAWLIAVIVTLVVQRRLRWWMAVAPLGGLLVMLLLSANVPLHVRWAGSQDAFAAALASPDFGTATNGDGYLSPPVQVGTFEIIGFSRDGDRAQFDDSSSFCGTSGFAYLPGGDPSVIGGGDATNSVDLGDAWFAFEVPC